MTQYTLDYFVTKVSGYSMCKVPHVWQEPVLAPIFCDDQLQVAKNIKYLGSLITPDRIAGGGDHITNCLG